MDTHLHPSSSNVKRFGINPPPIAHEPDPTQAFQWFEAIHGSPNGTRLSTEWRLFNERGYPSRLYGPVGDVLPRLLEHAASGRQVYAVVNSMDAATAERKRSALAEGRYRAESFVTRYDIAGINALFVDMDEDHGDNLQRITDATLPPSVVVRSSKSYKLHAYWLVNDVPVTKFRSLQKGLAQYFGGDPAICDPARIMRVPGFLHQKPGSNAVRCELMHADPSMRYDLSHLIDAFGLQPQDDTRTEATSVSLPLKYAPEAFDVITRALTDLDANRLQNRHMSIRAFLNLYAYCGRLDDGIRELQRDEVRTSWIKDGSIKSHSEWLAEIDGWMKADASDQRLGIPFLRENGFRLGELPPRPQVGGEEYDVTAIGADLLEYPLTDYGSAERLLARHGRDLRHVQEIGWHLWTGSHWRSTDKNPVVRRAVETARALGAAAHGLSNDDERKKVLSHASKGENKTRIDAAVNLAATVHGVELETDALDRDPNLLNVQNGTINLESGELRAHDRDDYISRIADVQYDPSAKAPRWLQFQEEITNGDQELIDFKQRMYGYALTGHTTEQVIFIAFGGGANGKTTEIETVLRTIGDYGRTTSFDTFTIKNNDSVRNDLARLAGSRLVSASEGEAGKRLAESLIKDVSGGEKIAARFLYKEYFEFTPQFKVLLVTNHKPIIRGNDVGIWRRIRLIPYTVTIPAPMRDSKLSQTLREEAPGILNWLVAGAKSWYENGLGSCTAVERATDEYRNESDLIGQFISDVCQLEPTASEDTGVLYNNFRGWAIAHGLAPWSANAFGRELSRRGFEHTESRHHRQGIKVLHATFHDAADG